MTEIGKANFTQKGIYWQAFTNLSIGLERLAKLTVLLNLLIEKNGVFPSNNELKKYGHDLNELYNTSKEIINARNLAAPSVSLNQNVHTSILRVLNNFAKGDRYSNLDFLTGKTTAQNPVNQWSMEVDDWIWEYQISTKQQEKIYAQAINFEALMKSSGIFHISENNDLIDDMYTFGVLFYKWSAIAPYRRVYLAHIIKYWAEILCELEHICRKKHIQIPYLREFFALFLSTDDKYAKTRKNWQRLY